MKQAFFIIHILLLTLVAYQGVSIMYKGIAPPALNGMPPLPDSIDRVLDQTEKQDPISPERRNQKISTRNIFKVLLQESDNTPVGQQPDSLEKPLEKTELKIALWGTVIGATDDASYAVIEDQKEKQQSLFQVGDEIQQATIKEIMRNKIILTFNGKDQILEVDNTQQPAGMISQNNPLPMQEEPRLEDMLAKAPQETGPMSLMKQVRIRPYFKNGKPNGLLIYGIKPGSIFQNLGLRNGDIVQELNGTQTLTAQDARMIYQDMETTSDMRFTVLRQGQKKEIVYNVQENAYTEQAVPTE